MAVPALTKAPSAEDDIAKPAVERRADLACARAAPDRTQATPCRPRRWPQPCRGRLWPGRRSVACRRSASNRSCARVSAVSASESVAVSRTIIALSLSTAACAVRSSSFAIRSPCLTVAPSVATIEVMMPCSCAAIVVVSMASAQPEAVTSLGSAVFTAATVLTSVRAATAPPVMCPPPCWPVCAWPAAVCCVPPPWSAGFLINCET